MLGFQRRPLKDDLIQNKQKRDLYRSDSGRVILVCMSYECNFRSPEKTFRVSDLLESGLTELSKALVTHGYSVLQ